METTKPSETRVQQELSHAKKCQDLGMNFSLERCFQSNLGLGWSCPDFPRFGLKFRLMDIFLQKHGLAHDDI